MSRKSEPLISVVTVVLNDRERLRPTLESLRTGLPNDSELVIVDGGSTDGTLDLIETYGSAIPRLRVIHQTSKGLYAAMNEGSRAAQGRYLYFLNAGDRLAQQGELEAVATGLAGRPSTLGLASVVHETAGRVVGPYDFDLRRFLHGKVPYNHQGTVFQRQALLAVGGYNPEFGIMADFAVMALLARDNKPEVFTQVLAMYEGGGISEVRGREIPYLMHKVRCEAGGLDRMGRLGSWGFALAQGLRRHGLSTFRSGMGLRSSSV
ncbi:glycosyltransferase [Arthrobacter globiformis]|uniref:4,4'-diaponeurosporenoate glycosyltransferase n=1 Tax=Arthrobacter globiformis TaxID=1665 RepID=A0A328HFR1_ARTGO|nr:hypothetical protein DBZ45_12575 [Arthrobacter globiformis]